MSDLLRQLRRFLRVFVDTIGVRILEQRIFMNGSWRFDTFCSNTHHQVGSGGEMCVLHCEKFRGCTDSGIGSGLRI